MTVVEVARLLEISPKTVYDLCRAGLLGHMRIGVRRGTIRIEEEDVERFKLEARAKGASPPPPKPSVAHTRAALAGVKIPLPNAATYVPKHIRRPGRGNPGPSPSSPVSSGDPASGA